MKLNIVLGTLFVLTATKTMAQSPDPGTVHITDIQYFGNGCSQGSVASNISDDGQAMTLLFDDYIVESNGSRTSAQCDLNIGLSAPAGWTFGIFCVDVRGYASLDDQVRGQQTVDYQVGTGEAVTVGELDLVGPFDEDYQNLTALPVSTISWAPCGQTERRELNIATDVSITPTAPQTGGLMTVDSVDGDMQHHYGIAWKRCPDAQPAIELAQDSIEECSDLTINFSGFPVTSTAKGNWITIAEVGSLRTKHTFRDLYLPQTSSGTVALPTRGLDPDKTYEVRAFEDWEGTRSWDIKDAKSFQLRPNGCVTPTIATDRLIYNQGDRIAVNFAGLLQAQSNWITVALPNEVNWRYQKFQWLPQTLSGTTTVDTSSLPPGIYEIRIYENWSSTKDYYIFDRQTIEVR